MLADQNSTMKLTQNFPRNSTTPTRNLTLMRTRSCHLGDWGSTMATATTTAMGSMTDLGSSLVTVTKMATETKMATGTKMAMVTTSCRHLVAKSTVMVTTNHRRRGLAMVIQIATGR